MTVRTIEEVRVIIVGGGPAGLTMAMELALRGVRSIVIERRLGDELPSPRCNTTNARSMEIFRRLGCADAVRAAGLPEDFNTDVVYMTRFTGHELTRYARSTPADVRGGTMHGVASEWPTPEPQHFISQIFLEPVLREHARRAYGVEILEGWECVNVAQTPAAVSIDARCVTTGERRTLVAEYVIAADGGGSAIRRQIGARLEGIPEIGNACSIYMQAPRLRALYARTPGWMYRFASGGVLVAIDGADRWLLHLNRPPGMQWAGVDFEPAMFAAIGEPFEYRVLSDVRWTARAMVANRYRRDRIFLIGDAAHIWIPMGGFGMNAAIADAGTLGWMLAGTLEGWLDPKILDVYEAERSPVGSLVASHAVRWARDIAFLRFDADQVAALEADPVAQADLGARIRGINIGEFECPGMQLGTAYIDSPAIVDDGTPPPPFTLETYTETSHPGVRAPHVRRADTGAPIFDEFGPGFTLLRIGPVPANGATLQREAERRSIPLVTLDVPEPAALRKYEGFDLVLVRPDGHVAWRGAGEPADARAVFDRVTGVLVPEPAVEVIAATPLPATPFTFGEGTRWHAGRLVFSDMLGGRVVTYDAAAGSLATLAVVPGRPNGLAISPGGQLFIASMDDRKIFRLANDGHLEEHADLSALATGYLGDMVADAAGRLYVDDVGARVLHGEAPRPGRLLVVDIDGSARVVLDDLAFPNGLAITPDGNTLLLAETMSGRVTQSRIDARTGDLSDTRPFLQLVDDGCDGMAIDRTGGIWLCLPRSGDVDRYDRAGRLTARVDLGGELRPIACALDADEAALYIVGIEPLREFGDIFGAMSRGETVGRLACARLRTIEPMTVRVRPLQAAAT